MHVQHIPWTSQFLNRGENEKGHYQGEEGYGVANLRDGLHYREEFLGESGVARLTTGKIHYQRDELLFETLAVVSPGAAGVIMPKPVAI